MNVFTDLFGRADNREIKINKIEKWCFANTAFIVYCFMVAIIISSCVYNPKQACNANIHTILVYEEKGFVSAGCNFSNPEKKVTCSKVEINIDLVQEISAALKDNYEEITLEIQDSILKTCVLESGWLNTKKFAVGKLKLKNVKNLIRIGEEAFEGLPFERLKELTIDNCDVDKLNNNIFKEASLSNFELRCNEGSALKVQEGFLDGLKFLSVFQLQKCNLDPEDIENLFQNTKNYFRFQDLDLRYNHITELRKNSFLKIEKVESFSLSNSDLKTLHKDVFQNLTFTKLLLNDNELTSLPEGIFDYKHGPQAKVFLNGNGWNCDCKLQWLKTLYLESDLIYKKNPPLCFNKLEFEKVDFCAGEITTDGTTTTTTSSSSTTTTISSSSTSTTTTTTEEGGANMLTIKCHKAKKPPSEPTALYETVTIGEGNIELEFYEYDSEEADFLITMKNNANQYKLLWFDTNNTQDISCTDSSRNDFFLQNLTRNSTYNICLVGTKNAMSPFDCIGFAVPLEKGERTWISRRYIIATMGTFFAALLLCILIGALSMYYLLRKHPSLLKGSKGIVVVKNTEGADTKIEEYRRTKPYYVKNLNVNSCYGNYDLQARRSNYSAVVEELNANRLPNLLLYRQKGYGVPLRST